MNKTVMLGAITFLAGVASAALTYAARDSDPVGLVVFMLFFCFGCGFLAAMASAEAK